MKDLTHFIQNELYPSTWEYIPRLFPEMDFSLKGGKWCSHLHFDATEPTHPRADKSVVTPKYPHRVFDNGRQESKDLIDLYKDLNHLTDTIEAVRAMCQVVGLELPESTPEQKEKYRKKEERRTLLEQSAKRQQDALFSPCGASVLEYLHSRGWGNDEIRGAELGYISEDEARVIGAQYGIGQFYTLSIPLRTGSRIYGFKFRTIQANLNGQSKYIYLQGTEKKGNLFNLTGIKQNGGDIVVVEGELDALHAREMGFEGIVATSGGELTEELLEAALLRGISRITLLFDKDERGEGFVKASIRTAHERGISVLVATYPDEALADGSRIHDTDEYLKAHSVEDLRQLVNNAQSGSSYLLESLIKDTIAKYGEDNLPPIAEQDLLSNVCKLVNELPNETEREAVCSQFSLALMLPGQQAPKYSKEAILAHANHLRAVVDNLNKKEEAEEASRKASSLLKDGKVDEALSVMEEAAKVLKRVGLKGKYSHLLPSQNLESLASRMQKKQGAIPTRYEFINPNTKETELLSLPSGAITFVVAPTSHGKSTFLQNLALQTAENEEEGTVLYFTFEEEADSVTLQLLNKCINAPISQNNIRSITSYYRKGTDGYIKETELHKFHRGQDKLSKLLTEKRLQVFYEDYDSTELIAAIRYIATENKVKAVFIDYIQLLSKNGNRKQRTEELKDICKDLKDLCVETQLPIIVAAQANREVTSPLEMHSQKIAEAADLERIANKVIFIWNSAFVAQKSKDSKSELEEFETRTGITLGQPGRIYAKQTKNRGGVVNIEAVLEFNGNTGVIKPNKEKPEAKQIEIDYPF